MTISANVLSKRSMLSVATSLNRKWMTGCVCHFQPSRSIASPLKSSRRPVNSALNAETVSDLPKRRGRDMKTTLLFVSDARRCIYAVLSTYMALFVMRSAKSLVPVLIPFMS